MSNNHTAVSKKSIIFFSTLTAVLGLVAGTVLAAAPVVDSIYVTTTSARIYYNQTNMNVAGVGQENYATSAVNLANYTLLWGTSTANTLYPLHSGYGQFMDYTTSGGAEGVAIIFGLNLTEGNVFSLSASNVANASLQTTTATITGTIGASADPLIQKIENTTAEANACYGYPCGKATEQITITGLRFDVTSGVQVSGLGTTQTVTPTNAQTIVMTIPADASVGNAQAKVKNLTNSASSNQKYLGVYSASCGVIKGKLTNSAGAVGADQNNVPVRLESWHTEYGSTESHNNGFYAVVGYSGASCATGSYDVFFATPAGASAAAPVQVGSQAVTANTVTDAGTKAFVSAAATNVTGTVKGPVGTANATVGMVGVPIWVHNDSSTTNQKAITDKSGNFKAYVPTTSAANYYWIEAQPSAFYQGLSYTRGEKSLNIAQGGSALLQTVNFAAMNVQGTVKTPTSIACADTNLNPYPNEAVRYARICLHTQDWSTQVCTSADANGVFQVGVAAGSNYILEIDPQWGDDKYGGYTHRTHTGITIQAELTNLDTVISGGPRLGVPNIFGRVYGDANSNGLYTTGEEIASVYLNLNKEGFWQGVNTNSEGKFRLSVSDAGTYTFHIDSSGTYSAYNSQITISVAEVSSGKNLGDIPLPSPNVSGSVYGPLGTSAATTLQQNVGVELCPYQQAGQCYNINTGQAGTFGTYVPNGTWNLNLRTGSGSIWATPSAQIVVIASGAVSTVGGDTNDSDEPLLANNTLKLRLSDPSVNGLTGYVYGPTGTVGQQANLGLRATGSMGQSQWSDADATGRFAFGGVEAGTYELEVMPTWGSQYSRKTYALIVHSDNSVDVDGVSNYNRTIIVRLAAPNITGTLKTPVYSAGYAGLGIADTEFNLAVAYGWINMRQAGPVTGPGKWYGTNTSAEGAFQMGGVAAGTYIIEYSPGWGSKFSMVQEQITITAAVAAGTETLNLNTASSKASAGAVRLSLPQLRGTVVKNDGTTAVQNAYVMIYNASHSTNQGSNTDSSGKFSVGGLADGTYSIEVNMPWGQGLVAPSGLSVVVSSSVGVVKKDNVNLDNNTIVLEVPAKTISGWVKIGGTTAVANAKVEAHKDMGGGFVETTTTANGTYSMRVSGGNWWVSVRPDWGSDINWAYTDSPTRIEFANTSAVQTSEFNFSVLATNAFVTGYVKKADGTAISNCWVNVCQDMGMCNSRSTDSTGRFSIRVTAGTYRVSAFPPGDLMNTFGAPDETIVTVAANETKDAGTLTLKAKNSSIKGRVQDQAGNAIQNVAINSWQFNGGGWGMTFTDSSGNFTLKVAAGKWGVMVAPMSTQYVYQGAPLIIEILDSETKENNNFTLKLANATIKGNIRLNSATGDIVTDVFGGVWVKDVSGGGFGQMMEFGGAKSDMMQKSGMMTGGAAGSAGPMGGGMESGGMGTGLWNGAFELKVPAGTYEVGIGMPPGSSYTLSATQTVTIVADETKTIDLIVKQNNATVSGYFYLDADNDGAYDSGEEITGIRAMVNADKPGGGWQKTESNYTTGAYSLSVSEGTWYMNAFIDPFMTMAWGGTATGNQYMVVASNQSVTLTANSTTTLNFKMKKLDATIQGTVTDHLGGAMAGVWVFPDLGSAAMKEELGGPGFGGLGAMTNASGVYNLKVTAGTYKVLAGIPPWDPRDLLNPDPLSVTVGAAATVTGKNLQFKISDATITGSITLNGTNQVSFVRAWSDAGKGSGVAASSGTYSLKVTQGDVWHLVAVAKIDNTLYESLETTVTTVSGTASYVQNLPLVSKNLTIPDPVTSSFDSTQSKTITLTDGLTLDIPAGSIATSGTITVSVTPTVDIKSDGKEKLVGYGYSFGAKDSSGATITDFVQDVTIIMPYNEAAVTAAGYSEDSLTPKYYDEILGVINTYDSFVRDTVNNNFIIKTDHFSDGGSMGGEVPTAPSGLTAIAQSSSAILLSWTDNSSDETGFKVYRNSADSAWDAATLVTTTAANATSYTDTSRSAGTAYYYRLKATNTSGDSGWTSTASATTLGAGGGGGGGSIPGWTPTTGWSSPAPATTPAVTPAAKPTVSLEGVTIPALTKSLAQMTKSELQAKIAEFVAVIKQLQTLLAQVTVTPAIPSEYKFKVTLKYNQTSDDVRYLQEFLKAQGIEIYPEGIVSGWFGAKTKAAVIRFQEKYASDVLAPFGLAKGTGLVGAKTLLKINEILGK